MTARIGRAITLAKQGNHARATADVEALARREDLTNVNVYDLACLCSLSSAAAGRDDKLSPADRARLKAQHAERAMDFLKKAVAMGYRHPAAMKTDHDLDRSGTAPTSGSCSPTWRPGRTHRRADRQAADPGHREGAAGKARPPRQPMKGTDPCPGVRLRGSRIHHLIAGPCKGDRHRVLGLAAQWQSMATGRVASRAWPVAQTAAVRPRLELLEDRRLPSRADGRQQPR